MDQQRSRYFGLIAIIAGSVLVLGLVFYLFSPERSGSGKGSPENTTTIESAVSDATDNLTVNYEGDSNPNTEAVRQSYRIIGYNSLTIPAEIKDEMQSMMFDQLNRQVTPTYPSTYVHIEKGTLQCSSLDDCHMRIYIDSPESYFDFSVTKVNDRNVATLRQLPWKGVN